MDRCVVTGNIGNKGVGLGKFPWYGPGNIGTQGFIEVILE